jgi:phosphoribosyl 1,2-cyclic phosphodiesterase
MAVDFAVEWNIKKLVLFHHEPNYDDIKMSKIYKSAVWYSDHLKTSHNTEIILAREGLELELE